ncbi:DUF6531 domain-containing protein, partial [Pectobacterium odoriferum]|uniref:DUF6531 domain-containing protein n=1 Tax=Pectobacterium odoriferum TaxID=78398 RepID=UPI0032F0772F
MIRVIPGLGDAIKVDGWIVALMKDRFSKMLDYLDQLVKRYDEAIATLEKEFDKFIPLIVTRVSGSPRPKGSFAKKADAPQSHTTAESRAASPSSGSKSESTDAPTATKQSDAKPGGDKGKDQPPKKQSPEKNTPHKSEPSKPTDAVEEKPKPKAPVEKKSQSAPAEAENINAGKNTEKPSGKKGAEAQSNDGKTPADSKNSKEKGDPVDMATGAVVEKRTDIQLSGQLPLSLQRYYRSTGERYAGLLGTLWRTNWDISLTLNNGVATLTDGEFNQAFFVLPNEGEVSRSPSNLQWRLTR